MGAASGRSTLTAAFLAVALLSFAQVKSQIMQVVAAAPAAASVNADHPDMPGMGHGVTGAKGAASAPSHKTCEYCAAAAHAPVCATVSSVPASTVVAWTHYAPTRSADVRWRAALTPRARGPPLAPSTTA